MHTIRKPRVFLSHSKKDVEFIHRLEADLRGCQCEPWIDEIEIRHGRPWLDEIFASGIPSCEILLCYITENSLESSMVRQEIDARVIERLQNDRVTLLLYVDSAKSRSKLRIDLQRLQTPELNSENYQTMLPKVIAAIWQSYAEHAAAASAQSEKVKRLEAEIRVKELEEISSKNIFTASEAAEFSVIWSRLDRDTPLEMKIVKKEARQIGGMGVIGEKTKSTVENTTRKNLIVNVGHLFLAAVTPQKFQPRASAVHEVLRQEILRTINLEATDFEVDFDLPVDFDAELLRYGLVERQPIPPEASDTRLTSMIRERFRVVFTSKFDRFSFWLDHSFKTGAILKPVVRHPQ